MCSWLFIRLCHTPSKLILEECKKLEHSKSNGKSHWTFAKRGNRGLLWFTFGSVLRLLSLEVYINNNKKTESLRPKIRLVLAEDESQKPKVLLLFCLQEMMPFPLLWWDLRILHLPIRSWTVELDRSFEGASGSNPACKSDLHAHDTRCFRCSWKRNSSWRDG